MISLAEEKWETWPPEGHRERLENYARYRQLFLGQHHEVYARVQAWLEAQDQKKLKEIVYVVCNFAGLISKLSADLLFGEQPRFIVGDENSSEQQVLDDLVSDNTLHTRSYEMALSCSWRGDCVYKVRWGKYSDWREGEHAIIEPATVSGFFPHLNPDNIQEMTGATLAWEKEVNGKRYLRKEIHEPGRIRNELWLLDGNRIREQVSLNTIEEYADLPEEQETGYPGLLVEHVPNWRLDDMFWGISDYIDLESLIDELNNRVSRISRVLDKHENPKLILPPGIMQYDEATRRYYIEKEALDAIEVEPSEVGDLPKYLVWDAQLDAAFKQIDKLLEMLFLVSETSPDAFGMGKSGHAESGRALKFRLLRTLAKINRKKLYFDIALKNVLYAAMYLEAVHGGKDIEPKLPRIEWQDGLPQDPLEAAQIEQIRMASGTTSLESALRRLDGLDGQVLQEELQRIQGNRPVPATRPNVTLPPPPEEGEQ